VRPRSGRLFTLPFWHCARPRFGYAMHLLGEPPHVPSVWRLRFAGHTDGRRQKDHANVYRKASSSTDLVKAPDPGSLRTYGTHETTRTGRRDRISLRRHHAHARSHRRPACSRPRRPERRRACPSPGQATPVAPARRHAQRGDRPQDRDLRPAEPAQPPRPPRRAAHGCPARRRPSRSSPETGCGAEPCPARTAARRRTRRSARAGRMRLRLRARWTA